MGTSWGFPGAQLPETSLVQELTVLVWITKRTKNAAPSREQLKEIPLKGRNLLIALERNF